MLAYLANVMLLLCQVGDGNPSLPSADPGTEPVRIEIRVEDLGYAVYDPVPIEVLLTNPSKESIHFLAERDGLPLELAVHYSPPGVTEPLIANTLRTRLGTAGDAVLAPSETAVGEVVLLEGSRKHLSGEPALNISGEYSIRVCIRFSYETKGVVCSNEVRLNVAQPALSTQQLLSKLDRIVADVFTVSTDESDDPARARRDTISYLKRVLKEDDPLVLHPDQVSADEQTERFVTALAPLVADHPDLILTAYIARYVALRNLARIEQDMFPGRYDDDMGMRSHPLYQQTHDLLQLAIDQRCWPAYLARYHRAMLYGLGREWDRADALCDAIEREDRTATAIAEVKKLREGLAEYKARCTASKVAD